MPKQDYSLPAARGDDTAKHVKIDSEESQEDDKENSDNTDDNNLHCG